MGECRCVPNIPSPAKLFDLSAWEHSAIFNGVEYVWDALKQLRSYLEDLPRKDFPLSLIYKTSSFLGGDNIIYNGAVILPYTTIDAVSGPVLLGAGARIGPCAYIRGPALISKDCVVGHCSEVKNSILMPGSHASHRCYAGDSILGNKVNLANNTSLNNWRFKEKEVEVIARCKCSPDCLCRDIHIKTGMGKFGSILGDKVKTGSNVAINPGTIIHPDSWLYSAKEYGPGILTKGMIRMDRKHL